MARKKQQGNRTLRSRATAVVIDPSTNRVLLVKHSKSNQWALPGGQPYANEEPGRRVAIEVAQQTGVIIGEPVFVGRHVGHVSAHQIFIATGQGDPRIGTSKIQDATWWDLDTPLRLEPHVSAILAIVRQELPRRLGEQDALVVQAIERLPMPVNRG